MSDAIASRDIVQIARDSLSRHKRDGWIIEVLDEGVRQDDGWWYLPVCPNKDERTSSYYDILSEVEGELQDERGLDILLVPASRRQASAT